MNTGKIIEKISDLCEPYADGEPDLYDMPVYANGSRVSAVNAIGAEAGKPDRVEITTECGKWESVARAIETISESDALRQQLDKLTDLYSS